MFSTSVSVMLNACGIDRHGFVFDCDRDPKNTAHQNFQDMHACQSEWVSGNVDLEKAIHLTQENTSWCSNLIKDKCRRSRYWSISASTELMTSSSFLPLSPSGGFDGHQMALLQLPWRWRVRSGDLGARTGRPGPAQLHALRAGQPAVRVAPQDQAGRQGAVDFLVGWRAQPVGCHPSRAGRWAGTRGGGGDKSCSPRSRHLTALCSSLWTSWDLFGMTLKRVLSC